MKRLFSLALLLLAGPALCGTLTVTTTTAQDNSLARAVTRANRETCKAYGLPGSCTQPQARKAFCAMNGFGSVVSCTGSGAVNIYADSASFFQDEAVTLIKSYKQRNAADDAAAFAAALAAASQAQKDAACVALGLSAGCQ